MVSSQMEFSLDLLLLPHLLSIFSYLLDWFFVDKDIREEYNFVANLYLGVEHLDKLIDDLDLYRKFSQ